MMTPLQLGIAWRDFPLEFTPLALREAWLVLTADCFIPRWYQAPADADEVIPPDGHVQYNLSLKPGSWIFGFYHVLDDVANLSFLVRILDLTLGHDWFGGFLPDGFVAGKPYLLPKPYPVVGKGQFLVELHNPETLSQRCQLIFGVCEPRRIQS